MRRLEKNWTERDVHQAALERFEVLYGRFDTVAVSFSGGKDSTVCLHLALETAKALNTGPGSCCAMQRGDETQSEKAAAQKRSAFIITGSYARAESQCKWQNLSALTAGA